MTAAFLITLREGLEAALLVGIICAYLVKAGRSDALPMVAVGVITAVALCIGAGILVVGTVGRLPLAVQETFEGIAAVTAVVILTWMLFWMRRQGRLMKGELEAKLGVALTRGGTWALIGLVFVAVVREGLETVLFMLAILTSRGEVTAALLGGTAGLLVAALLGWAIFRLGIRIDLRRFFTITGVLLIFVAAGLCMAAVAEFTEAGLLPPTPTAFDVSGILPESSPLGSVLAGLVGYREAPSVLQVAVYLAYLVPVLALFLVEDRLPFRRREAAGA